MNLPIDKLATITDKDTAVTAVQTAATGLTTEQKQSPTGIDLVTLFAEEAVAQAASTTVSGNGIIVSQSTVQALQLTANDTKTAIEQTLASSGITPKRDISADVKFKATSGASVTITIEPSAAATTADNVYGFRCERYCVVRRYDISGKSKEMQNAIGVLASKGIINGTSATTFAPKKNIQKDQIVAICARTLRSEMRYKNPSDVSAILGAYTDASSIEQWALTDIALATRENLVVKRTDGRRSAHFFIKASAVNDFRFAKQALLTHFPRALIKYF